MADYPTSLPNPSSIEEEFYKPQVKTEFEAGYVQSRCRATRARYRWSIGYDALTIEEYESLKTFFNNNQGSSFNWTHPTTSSGYVVRFSDDSISATAINGYNILWGLELNLEQV